jgi:translation initiation factor 4E
MNNIPTVEDMSPDNDYHLFREGIKPAWEDPENARGGSFVINCVDKAAPVYWVNSVFSSM